MVQKVVFFDYWTVGINNFVPVAERLKSRGVECLLVHLGSWRDPSAPTEQVIQGVRCRDIRAYGGDLRRALLEEKPHAVLSLNTTMTMDRVLHRLARSLGIRTLYMMHGTLATGSDHDWTVKEMNRHWSLFRRLAKVSKYVGVSARYLRAVAQDRAVELLHPATYGHFAQLILQPGTAFERPWRHPDVYADEALVYAPVYRDLMIDTRGYPPERVTVVGNPNLDDVFALKNGRDATGICLAYVAGIGLPTERKFAVYVEDAFVEQGIAGWTDDIRVSEIRQVAAAVHAAGLDLVIKMHPGSQSVGVQSHFSGTPGVHVVLKADLPRLIGASVAVVGHSSTALMIPIVLGKALLVPTWSPGLEGAKSYVGERVALAVSDPASLTRALTGIGDVRAKLREGRIPFEKNFIGPTDGNAWERIVSRTLASAMP